MMVRLSKCALLFGVALFFSLVVFNNTTDYDSNFQFVRHVLMMDSTFANNHGMWRAIHQPLIHTMFYLSVICWESFTCLLCWWGFLRVALTVQGPAAAFQNAKSIAVAGLTLGCMLWFIAFLCVGGEWFLMWQSKTWNGQDAAFRMFAVLTLVLIYITLPEHAGETST